MGWGIEHGANNTNKLQQIVFFPQESMKVSPFQQTDLERREAAQEEVIEKITL